jgi:hypothetical protein
MNPNMHSNMHPKIVLHSRAGLHFRRLFLVQPIPLAAWRPTIHVSPALRGMTFPCPGVALFQSLKS